MHVERFESALWQTTSLLAVDEAQSIVVDPCISREEVARIAARAGEHGAEVVAVLATHADWDHVCGLAAFPEAEAAAGELTASRILSGEPWARVQVRASEYGLAIVGPPRVDRRLVAGDAYRVGPFTVETLALPGHTPDGTGLRLREPDVLAVGDYLSSIEFPFVTSTSAYRATLAALIDLLRRDPPAIVFPGHGPQLSPADALEIAEADLAYLWRLHDAAASGSSREEARIAALRVPPPRPCSDDLADMQAGNVEAQLRELFGGGVANAR